MIKVLFKITVMTFLVATSACYAYDLGAMVPGTAGWDYNPQLIEEIGITCNIPAGNNFSLSFSIPDFNSGDFVAADNVRLKVYYIGSDLSGVWVNNDTGILSAPFDGYAPTDPFVEYTGGSMEICAGNNSQGTARNIKIVLAITVYVPNDGRNMVGAYSSEVDFSLSNGTIVAVEPN